MNWRFSGIAVALLASSLTFAQRPGDEPGKLQDHEQTVPLERVKGGQKRAKAVTIDTLAFFPQISRGLRQKAIRPENPTRHLRLTGSGLPGGSTSMTSRPGPTVRPRFPGTGYTGVVPADPDIAVGPGHIVQVVNTTIAFYTKTGTLQAAIASTSFFSGVQATTNHFDPRVIYDRIADRFVIIFLELKFPVINDPERFSNFLFAISDDSDPNGTWHTYAFDARHIRNFADYPGMGYNKDGYVLNANLFAWSDGAFVKITFITVPKAAVMTGSPVTTTTFSDPTGIHTAQMAETVDPVNGYVFGAARVNIAKIRIYAFWNISESPDGGYHSPGSRLALPPPSTATTTRGQVFDTVGDGIFTAIWRGGSLYLSYNVANGDLTGVRWTEFDTRNFPIFGIATEVQAGNYMSETLNYFMPAINVNKHGDVSILFTGSNTDVTSDIVVATRVASDPLGTMSAPMVMASAAGDKYRDFRWGDYFGIDVDPVDDETFWGTAMVVSAANTWSTHIVSWTVSQTTMHVPTAFQWIRGFLQSGNLASLASDDADYMVTRAGITLFVGEPPAQLIVDAVGPSGTVLDFELSVVAKVNTPGLSQRIELWNYTNSSWDAMVTRLSTTSDSIHTAVPGGTLSDYLESGTNNMRAKVLWFQTGLTLLWPWTVSVDQVEWAVRTR